MSNAKKWAKTHAAAIEESRGCECNICVALQDAAWILLTADASTRHESERTSRIDAETCDEEKAT